MKDLNLKVKMKRQYKNTTDSNHNLPIAPNVLNREFYTKKQAKAEIFEYIEVYYNRTRSHSYLENLSPARFEEINFMLQNKMLT